MHVLLATYDAPGHLMPAWPLVQRLVARGHRVRWYSEQRYAALIAEAGAVLVPFDEFPAHPTPTPRSIEMWACEFVAEQTGQYHDLGAACDAERPDVLLADPACLGAGPAAAERNIPFGLFGCVPLLSWPHEAAFCLQATLGVCELPVPPAVVDRTFFIGPLCKPEAPWEPPAWWAKRDLKRPLIVVTQGTLATRARDLIIPALEALANASVEVVVTVHPSEVLLRPHHHAERWVPFGSILPHAACLVTNGGYGGVNWALAAGVPLVVSGATEDKPHVARRVVWAGTGLALEAPPPIWALREAISEVLLNPRYRERAQQLARVAATVDSATLGCQVLETVVPLLARGSNGRGLDVAIAEAVPAAAPPPLMSAEVGHG